MKLVSWNCHWCCGLDGVVDPRRIVEGAAALAGGLPDVLCLQEVSRGYGQLEGSPGDLAAELSALLPGHRFFFGVAVDESAPDDGGAHRQFGNAVASRLPVLQVRHHALPWPADPARSSMPRQATVVTVLDPDLGPVRVITTHLEYYSARQRSAQADALRTIHAEACAQAAAPPKRRAAEDAHSPFEPKAHTSHAVLCGDFNATATDPSLAGITRAFIRAPGARGRLHAAWPLVHGKRRQPATFRAIDRSGG